MAMGSEPKPPALQASEALNSEFFKETTKPAAAVPKRGRVKPESKQIVPDSQHDAPDETLAPVVTSVTVADAVEAVETVGALRQDGPAAGSGFDAPTLDIGARPNEVACAFSGEAVHQYQGHPVPTTAQAIAFDMFFQAAMAHQVSDVHFRIGYPPLVRKNGDLYPTNYPVMDVEAMGRLSVWLNTDANLRLAINRTDLDFSKPFGQCRLRINMLYEMGQQAFVIRLIKAHIPPLDSLGLPDSVRYLTTLRAGLVIVAGKTGSGKSTTLASMIEEINQQKAKHIITLEDPVEYAFTSKRGVVTQRQLGADTPSFPVGIRQALRQDPDVLLIGEIRDRDTAATAIKAAEMGVLVFSTLHTSEAIATFDRLVHFFEPHERDHIQQQLANCLQGIICQKLYKHPDGKHRSAVAEILLVTAAVRDYLLQNDLVEIQRLQEEGRHAGMLSLNAALLKLMQQKKITAEEALRVANHPDQIANRLKGIYQGASY
ncbi:MAG: PilT/PilU family type 4a pilus ATPase [Cyanobacteria bacterium HKST-UBA03]|nr:PilT/PilU family type 4a pilus ATPase [Cyanobacteria bacterium HKST-UBA03]